MVSRLAFFLALTVCSAAAAQPPLSEADAVAVAEQFVADNGYTDLPADLSKMKLELLDQLRKRSLAKIAAERHGQLERNAWGVLRGRANAPGWTVAFRYRSTGRFLTLSAEIENSDLGRAVTMDSDGARASEAQNLASLLGTRRADDVLPRLEQNPEYQQ
jgi:hypothetical protein